MKPAVPVSAAWLWIAVSASAADFPREPVSISAANYSQLSEVEVYERVHGTGSTQPGAPAVSEPARPIFYAFVPGEIYESDVPLETVYRELATPLTQRGYFNVVYQMKSGHFPSRIDYLLRIHCGERGWARPTVRTDKVTWGDDGLISKRRSVGTMGGFRIGPAVDTDREGLTPMDLMNIRAFLGTGAYFDKMTNGDNARDFFLVVVQAFRFEDVRDKKKKAACIWSTYIAVEAHQGQEFSSVLRAMVHTAEPYFGTTTDGLQKYDLPLGKVDVGEPVVVPGPQAAH
jgi:hypothetical protein